MGNRKWNGECSNLPMGEWQKSVARKKSRAIYRMLIGIYKSDGRPDESKRRDMARWREKNSTKEMSCRSCALFATCEKRKIYKLSKCKWGVEDNCGQAKGETR